MLYLLLFCDNNLDSERNKEMNLDKSASGCIYEILIFFIKIWLKIDVYLAIIIMFYCGMHSYYDFCDYKINTEVIFFPHKQFSNIL